MNNLKTVAHVLILWFVTSLCFLVVIASTPVQLVCFVLCRMIGRDFKLDINLKANLLERNQ